MKKYTWHFDLFFWHEAYESVMRSTHTGVWKVGAFLLKKHGGSMSFTLTIVKSTWANAGMMDATNTEG